MVPPEEARGRLTSAGGDQPYHFRASAGELAPREEDWDAVEEHLGRRTAWFERGELEEIYGEGVVEALDFETSRLLGVENSTLRRMADGRFPAGELADAQALLSVLFRRHMRGQRQRGE